MNKLYSRQIACLIVVVSTLSAQRNRAFEVASVKPAAPLDQARIAAVLKDGGRMPVGANVDSRRAEYTHMDLKSLIGLAYGVRPYQIAGPEWMASTRFDIVAKLPDGASKSEAPGMLRSLLEDRFGLVAHRVRVEHPVLALVVGRGGLKLKTSAGTPVPVDEDAPLRPGELKMDGPDGPIRLTADPVSNSVVMNFGSKGKLTRRDNPKNHSLHLEFSMTSMSGLADMLTQIFTQPGMGAERQIVDMTGIQGTYDATLDVSLVDMTATARSTGPEIPIGGAVSAAPDPDGDAPPLTEAIQKLGLKLESRTAPVQQLVIDHLEKTPTAN